MTVIINHHFFVNLALPKTHSLDTKAFLVPHDFTAAGDSAAEHAVKMASQAHANVHLLHIVKSAAEKSAAQKKLDDIVQKLKSNAFNVTFHTHIESGSIFTDIAKVADKIHATLIIMGTHGAKGVQQKLFGSFAIKVITSSNAPFVIVQADAPLKNIQRMVFPISLASESLQVSKIAGVLATDFKSEIHLIAQKERQLDLSQKLIIYSELVKKELMKLGVSVQVKYLEKTKTFHEQVIKYSKEINAEMIAITYHSERMLAQFDPFAQSIITNDPKIPVLIINGTDAGNYYY